MATNTDWTLMGLDNPDVIQHTLLARFENDTGAVIVDNNNPACVLMEAFAAMSTAQLKMMDDNVRPAIYPARAVTTMDLLKHISDYDYVDIFSAPCSATIMLIVEKSYIMTHSVKVEGKNYSKLEIPRSTQITIGEHTFGLYYPIEIRSNLDSDQFTVLYNTSIKNPLKDLDTNVLDFDFREYNGHKLAYIKIPVYQFKITGHDLPMINHSGFKKPIEYTDRFYALRCWADVLTNFGHDETESDIYERKELSLAVAGQTYDPNDPTVVFTPDEANKECMVEIPYVYFTEKRIRGTLHVDIYTTEGELNYQVPVESDEACSIDMFSNISSDEDEQYSTLNYAEPFRAMPALHATPISTNIVGGSNGLDFEQIRSRVINGVETNVLQTPADIDAYFASYGYTATLYRDGITDRIFIVHTTVRDNDNAVIGMDTIPTLFDFALLDEYGTIVKTDDSESTYTVLPSTLYKFDKEKQICVPLTDTERENLSNLPPTEKCDQYNSNVFTLSPFHLQISTAAKYPTTLTYDMLECKRLSRTFIAARDDQYGLALNSVNLDINRRAGDVKDRYRLSFRVSRVGFGTNVPVEESDENGQAEKMIRVLVGLKNDDKQYKWAEAVWTGTEEGDDDNSTNEIFELMVAPNYIFHQANNEHTVQMAFWDNNEFTDFYLTSEARVILLIKDGINLSKPDPAISDADTGLSIYSFSGDQCLETKFTSGQMVLPTSKKVSTMSDVGLNNYFAVTEQKCVLQFGSPIDELDQRINLTYSEAIYKKHLTTKFRTLEDDKYAKDEKGDLIIDYSYTSVGPNTKHLYFSKGVQYYYYENGVYKPLDVTEDQFNTAITQENIFIRNVTPTIVMEFPKGTLTCMTKTGEESVIPNKFTSMNYNGCQKVDKTGKKTPVTEAEMISAIMEGSSLTLDDSPTVPRFIVKETCDENADVIGKFELSDALHAKPISSMDNIWAKTGKGEDLDDGRRKNITVRGKNALKYVITDIANEREAVAGDDPLSQINMKTGSFLVLNNDYSEPKFVQLGTLGDEPISKVYTRLYYKFRDLTTSEKAEDERLGRSSEKNTWYCFVQAKNKETLLQELGRADGTVPLEDSSYEQNPKMYGLMYVMATMRGTKLATGEADQLVGINYFAFLTNMTYTATNETYTQTEDIIASAYKTYYIEVTDGIYRECTEEDFNADGSFKTGVVYLEHKIFEASYEIPDFSMIEKSAWEAHEVKVPIGDEIIVIAGREYCYKDKDLFTIGVTKWVDVVGVVPGDPITDYIAIEDTGDGIYYKKSVATCTDGDYAWEQCANRWPWEVSNWKMFGYALNTDGSKNHAYIKSDGKLEIISDWDRLHRYWEYSFDQVILDSHNKPLEDYTKDRSIQYLCDMMQMDAKLAQVTALKDDVSTGSNFGDSGPTANTYPTTVVNVLRTHFDNIGNARDTMFTNTRLFFEPVKSLGFANFNVGNGVTKSLPLDVSMQFRLHVTKDVYEDDILLTQLRSKVISIIDEQIDGGYVNGAEIATKIVEAMNGSVKWVDVLGIDDDPDLQTMKCDDASVRTHLAHRIKVMEDGVTIDQDRALDLEVVINE